MSSGRTRPPARFWRTGLATAAARPVRLVNVAFSGGKSSDLAGQLEQLLADQPAPDVAMIMVGGNDVTPCAALTALSRSTSARPSPHHPAGPILPHADR